MILKNISKTKLYWLCQLIGWGFYALIQVVLYILSGTLVFSYKTSLTLLFMSISGLTLTDVFRRLMKRYNWFGLPLYRLVLQVLAANILQGMVFMSINFMLEYSLGILKSTTIKPGFLLLIVINASLIFLLWSLIYFVIYFFRNYKTEEIERLRWSSAIKDFELNKLKSQLNPHFVFNALNSIRALIDEDPKKSQAAITQLSNILRNSLLADRAKTVSFEEELKTINDYLNLEKLRYEERLRPSVQIEPNALRARVPPMMIQTLIENAVKHGVSKQIDFGFVELTGYTDDFFLHICIRNTGLLENTGGPDSGFGLLNTRQRLELLYGPGAAHFSIDQQSDQIVVANLSIPLHENHSHR